MATEVLTRRNESMLPALACPGAGALRAACDPVVAGGDVQATNPPREVRLQARWIKPKGASGSWMSGADRPSPSAREWVDGVLGVSSAKDARRPPGAGHVLLVATPDVNAFPGSHDR